MKRWGVIAALVFLAFYAVLAGQVSGTEALTMVIPVASALALTVAMHRVAERHFKLRAPWFWLVTRTCVSIGRDSVNVGRFLLRSLWRHPPCPAGHVYRQRFRFGDDSAPEAARRALVTLSVSASANQYVIDVNSKDNLVAHSLVGKNRKSDSEWPV